MAVRDGTVRRLLVSLSLSPKILEPSDIRLNEISA